MTNERIAAGVAALNRLLPVAAQDTGQSGVVAKFLLGCYNGEEWPFDLTELRRLDSQLVADCLAVLAMDARPEREIHNYIQDGDAVFRKLWERFQPGEEPSLMAQDAPEDYRAKLVTYGEAPGYRSVSLCFDVDPFDDSRVSRVNLSIDAKDALRIFSHLYDIQKNSWSRGRPLDAKDGEVKPKFLQLLDGVRVS